MADEMSYTCTQHNATVKGSSPEELAKNIQKHVKEVHKEDMPMEEAMRRATQESKRM